MSLAVNLDWSLFQLDVKNIFLNRELEEEDYMKISIDFKSQTINRKDCILKKSLYGLKQSLRVWFEKST